MEGTKKTGAEAPVFFANAEITWRQEQQEQPGRQRQQPERREQPGRRLQQPERQGPGQQRQRQGRQEPELRL
ncbi:MAG: hypothetical protein ACM3JK_05445 [Betaproteobacteria bacterium]